MKKVLSCYCIDTQTSVFIVFEIYNFDSIVSTNWHNFFFQQCVKCRHGTAQTNTWEDIIVDAFVSWPGLWAVDFMKLDKYKSKLYRLYSFKIHSGPFFFKLFDIIYHKCFWRLPTKKNYYLVTFNTTIGHSIKIKINIYKVVLLSNRWSKCWNGV